MVYMVCAREYEVNTWLVALGFLRSIKKCDMYERCIYFFILGFSYVNYVVEIISFSKI